MRGMQITITLDSVEQLDGLEAAISLYCDMEGERSKDVEEFSANDKMLLDGARAVRAILSGKGAR